MAEDLLAPLEPEWRISKFPALPCMKVAFSSCILCTNIIVICFETIFQRTQSSRYTGHTNPSWSDAIYTQYHCRSLQPQGKCENIIIKLINGGVALPQLISRCHFDHVLFPDFCLWGGKCRKRWCIFLLWNVCSATPSKKLWYSEASIRRPLRQTSDQPQLILEFGWCKNDDRG